MMENDPETVVAALQTIRDDVILQKAQPQQPQPTEPQPTKARKSPDDLMTFREAAAQVRCSVKTFKGHVASGAVRYVAIGLGRKRQRKRITPADLNAFIEAQTRKDVACPSTEPRARLTGSSTFKSEVIAFSVQPQWPPRRHHDPDRLPARAAGE